MKESVFLHGVALANYRGIGKDIELLGPFQRFNFMIGANNAGKSCVLSFIANHVKPRVCTPHSSSSAPPNLAQLDVHLGVSQQMVRMGIGVPKSLIRTRVLEKHSELKEPQHLALLDSILETLNEGELLWVERKQGENGFKSLIFERNSVELRPLAADQIWARVWNLLTNKGAGGVTEHWIPETLRAMLTCAEIGLPNVNLIPAIREISPKGHEFTDWSGGGLIEELARLQNPGVHERHRLEKFERINKFLKSVTENSSATIEIPHDREHVLVHMDNKVLPLASLGTGIHEVVMLASFCTLMEQQIVCIEEPEIHLHPLLQRRFIQYLYEQTDNQYFIATHSPSIIDTPDAAVFHVTNLDGRTKIATVLSPSSRFDLCRELGYKASDLLQANAIVWVEGPSDRIYVRHWITSLAPDLREGTDYSIMFYGGRLLSHLSADELDAAQEDIDALIAVRKLNRNLAVLIDSDRAGKDAPINATKRRIQEELGTHGGLCWITSGREIENYVPRQTMSAALKEVYNKFEKPLKSGDYDHVLPFKTVEGKIFKDVDKVKVAKAVCGRSADLDILDLKDWVNSLVDFIRSANK